MSTAASSASSTITRSQSSRAPPSYSSEPPSRTRFNAAPPSGSHHRSGSRYHREAPPPSNPAALANVARRDFETTNVARSGSSRRSSSRDDAYDGPPPSYRSDSTRSHHRTSSRHGHSRDSSDMSAPATVVANGGSTPVAPPPAAAGQSDRPLPTSHPSGRKRTTITATTGQWVLGKTIGAGSMGKVKLAKNLETGEQVAVKIVPRQTPDEHNSSRETERADRSKEIRTAREAAMVTLLNHPYICGMRDVQRTNFHWYMLFEYVNGGQMLDYIISHGRLKEKQARKFGRQIASALDYCHRNSIVHRDLKIENILISKTGDIKIIDFGLSNLFSPRGHLKTFCGSLYFAAPELLQARQYTGPEVDVWSFGIVLYVLVCGKVPFDDQSMPQLHAKIKKGVVDYPQWLSAECRNIISRMLVTDPRQRASMSEIMNHPWMIKGFNAAPENYLPVREPLQLPLDPEIVEKMTGFDFGTPEYITTQLTKVLESEDYQNAVKMNAKDHNAPARGEEKKRGVFDFYKRRNSTTSRDTLNTPSAETVQLGTDPVNAYSPLISIYFLVREKRDRERQESNPGALALPTSPGEKPLRMPDLPAPEAAHTNQHAYELPGEKATGGRSRPRARTQGDEEVVEGMKRLNVATAPKPTSPAIVSPPIEPAPRKESTAAGLLRRLSTRRTRDRDYDREKTSQLQPPSLNIQAPHDLASPPRKSFSVRRTRRGDPPSTLHPGGSQPQHQDLLSAPGGGDGSARGSKFLGRSTSVNSADYRPRRLVDRAMSNRGASEGLNPPSPNEPPPTSGSDRSSISAAQNPKGVDLTAADARVAPSAPATSRAATTSRTKSLGHARRESIQARRQKREDERREANVPEETDAELSGAGATADVANSPGEFSRPSFLKNIFSVSTTSNKPLAFIRQDIMRVLKELGVEYTEIKGGFSCRHAPSIDLNKVVDNGPPSPDREGRLPSGHNRRISFGGLRTKEKDERDPEKSHLSRGASRRGPPDRSFITNSEGSDYDVAPKGEPVGERVFGETTTRVQSDTGENLVLKFDMLISKVPLFSLHGIQFRKVSGGMWQHREMAKKILDRLRL